MSLTARFIWFFSAITLSILIILGWVLAQAVEYHFEEMDLTELTTKHQQAKHLKNNLDTSQLITDLEYLMPSQAGWHFMLFDTNYKLLHTSSPDLNTTQWEDLTHQQLFSLKIKAESYRGLTQNQSTKNWHLVPLMSIEHHNLFMDYFNQILLASLLLALLSMPSLGWLMVTRGLKPLNEMNKLAAKVSSQNLGERLTLETLPKELQELATLLNEMLDRLESSFQRLSQFSSDIAHELRNPINNLMMQNQVTLTQVRSQEEYQDVLASNIEDYERLSRMVNDMLFLAKADTNLAELKFKKVDLSKVANNLIEFYQLLTEEKNIDILLKGTAYVQGDPLMLERALANLVSNAINHAESNSIITINLTNKANQTVISVTNTGDEINPKHQPYLFNRFYRADAARPSSGGLGLGLAITHSIVKIHQGNIALKTHKKLTSFIIHLPTEKNISTPENPKQGLTNLRK